MRVGRPQLERAAFAATFAACVSILFSIAVAQILMGLAFVLLIASRMPLRLPPVWLPMTVYMGLTVISWLLSGDLRHGLPQIRKFYVWLILLLAYSAFRTLRQVRWLVLAWALVASASAIYSFVQFWQKYQDALDAHQSFYQYYIVERITGFMSHWMTFGGEEMVTLLMLAAFLFFAPAARWMKLAGWAAAMILAVSMLLGMTRGIWFGTVAGAIYLLWMWKKWVVALAPVTIAAAMLIAPLRERVVSVFHPQTSDSNQFRMVVWRTGLNMIRAHPLFGLGPEQVGPQLEQYVPKDIPRPLPSGYYGHLHSIYIHYAAERGIPCMLAMMWFIGQALYDFAATLRRRRPKGDARFVLHGAIAAIIGLLVVGVVEYNLGDSEVLTMFLTTVAVGYLATDSL